MRQRKDIAAQNGLPEERKERLSLSCFFVPLFVPSAQYKSFVAVILGACEAADVLGIHWTRKSCVVPETQSHY